MEWAVIRPGGLGVTSHQIVRWHARRAVHAVCAGWRCNMPLRSAESKGASGLLRMLGQPAGRLRHTTSPSSVRPAAPPPHITLPPSLPLPPPLSTPPHCSLLFKRAIPPIISFKLGSLGFLTCHEFADYRRHLSNVIQGHEVGGVLVALCGTFSSCLF